jgi:hypothetical protein
LDSEPRDGQGLYGEDQPGDGSGRVMNELSRLGFFEDLSPVSDEEESSLIGNWEK